MPGSIEHRLTRMGIALPPAPVPVASYSPAVICGPLLYISGQLSRQADAAILSGKLGGDLSIEQGQAAARLAALNILAHAQKALGTLDRISQVARINGFVNAAPGFQDHPKVLNGASDVFVEILAEKGRHTRTAIGVASLPANAAVEVDAVILINV